MSQVGKQRAGSIESEQTKSSVGGASKASRRARKSAQKKSFDREVLDSAALIDAGECAPANSKQQQVEEQEKQQQQQQQQERQEAKNILSAKVDLHSEALRGADASLRFDKKTYQSAELNNNSIAPSSFTAQKPLETPLSLLTGLRMHTSNLRAAQKSGEQSASEQASGRKPAISKNEEQAAGAPEGQQRNSPSNVTSSTLVSYVESSLNPPEVPVGKTTTTASPAPYIPSYTSLFNYQRPSASTPSPLPEREAKAAVPMSRSSSSYSQHLLSESVKTTTTTTNSSRSPLIKQTAQPSDASGRGLFASSTNRQAEGSKRLPSIFDQTSGRLKEPIDYDESTSDRRRRLSRLAATNRAIINYQDREGEEDEEDVEEDEDVELDYQERNLDDDQSVSSAYSGTQQARNLLNNQLAATKRPTVNSSPESQKTGATHLIHQSKKQPGSSSRLAPVAGSRARGRSPGRREQLCTKISMGSQQQLGSGKKLSQGPQTQSQTRISFNEMSRPPSFNTTTQHLQHDGHDMKSASCRKLDLLEQAAHLDCACHSCSKNRKLAENLYHYHGHHQLGSANKLSSFNLNKTSDKNYPKTRFMHMVLKSIILVLCTLLLLLLLVGTILISHYLPQSMDKVVGATRQFNVTIAGRR